MAQILDPRLLKLLEHEDDILLGLTCFQGDRCVYAKEYAEVDADMDAFRAACDAIREAARG